MHKPKAAIIIFEPEPEVVHSCMDELHQLERDRYVATACYIGKGTIAQCSCGRKWQMLNSLTAGFASLFLANGLTWQAYRK